MTFLMKCRTSYLRTKILGNKELLGRSRNSMRAQSYIPPLLHSLFFLTFGLFLNLCQFVFCIDCSSKYITNTSVSFRYCQLITTLRFDCSVYTNCSVIVFFSKISKGKNFVLGIFF